MVTPNGTTCCKGHGASATNNSLLLSLSLPHGEWGYDLAVEHVLCMQMSYIQSPTPPIKRVKWEMM